MISVEQANIKYINNTVQNTMAKPGNSGFALLVVIIVLLLTSFLASELILRVRAEQKIAFNVKKNTKEYFLADAGINIALFRLLEPKKQNIPFEDEEDGGSEEDWKLLGGYTYERFFNKGKITYYTINESGKIDLNKVPRRLLELFLEHYEVEPDQIETIIDSLLDWRDTDDLHRLNGAEQEEYEKLDDPYIPRNGPIEDPGEFMLVYGTDILFDKIKPYEVFTTYNPTGKINFNNLTPAILDFVMEGDTDKMAAYREDQKTNGTFNSAMARQVMGDERFDLLQPFLDFSEGSGKYYSITSIGQANVKRENEDEEAEKTDDRQHGIKIEALIHLKGSSYELLSWREGYTS